MEGRVLEGALGRQEVPHQRHIRGRPAQVQAGGGRRQVEGPVPRVVPGPQLPGQLGPGPAQQHDSPGEHHKKHLFNFEINHFLNGLNKCFFITTDILLSNFFFANLHKRIYQLQKNNLLNACVF